MNLIHIIPPFAITSFLLLYQVVSSFQTLLTKTTIFLQFLLIRTKHVLQIYFYLVNQPNNISFMAWKPWWT